MKRTSDIPNAAQEWLVSEYKQASPSTVFKVMKCILNGEVVGRRAYDGKGNLILETPLKNNKKHGREYTWNEQDSLELVEPYFEGKLHGLAKQYGRKGKVIGTYRCVHGTGLDIWRSERKDGSIIISEIHSLKDGQPHGCEWWLRDDQHSVWHECHWSQGLVHGIERIWDSKGSLKRGYPKFWINGQTVSKRTYLKRAELDEALPALQLADNQPQRWFPAEIEALFTR